MKNFLLSLLLILIPATMSFAGARPGSTWEHEGHAGHEGRHHHQWQNPDNSGNSEKVFDRQHDDAHTNYSRNGDINGQPLWTHNGYPTPDEQIASRNQPNPGHEHSITHSHTYQDRNIGSHTHSFLHWDDGNHDPHASFGGDVNRVGDHPNPVHGDELLKFDRPDLYKKIQVSKANNVPAPVTPVRVNPVVSTPVAPAVTTPVNTAVNVGTNVAQSEPTTVVNNATPATAKSVYIPTGTSVAVSSVNTGGVSSVAVTPKPIETDNVQKPVSLLQPPPKRKRTQCYLPRLRPVEIEDIEYEYPVYIHSIKYDEEFSAILIKFRNHDIEPVILNRYTISLYNKKGERIHHTSIGKNRFRYRGRLYIGKRSHKEEYRDSTFVVVQRKHLKSVFPKVKENHGRIGSAFVMFHKYLFDGNWIDKEWSVKISCGEDVVFQYPPESTEENETDDEVANAPMNPYLKSATMWATLKKR